VYKFVEVGGRLFWLEVVHGRLQSKLTWWHKVLLSFRWHTIAGH